MQPGRTAAVPRSIGRAVASTCKYILSTQLNVYAWLSQQVQFTFHSIVMHSTHGRKILGEGEWLKHDDLLQYRELWRLIVCRQTMAAVTFCV